jgi:hypothetical protein
MFSIHVVVRSSATAAKTPVVQGPSVIGVVANSRFMQQMRIL